MQRRVHTAHRSNYPNPIAFTEGEIVTLGRTDNEYPGWIRARLSDGNEGWAPESLLVRQADGSAVATADYTARELDTDPGQHLELVRELEGWFWARNERGEEGWVPLKTTYLQDVSSA